MKRWPLAFFALLLFAWIVPFVNSAEYWPIHASDLITRGPWVDVRARGTITTGSSSTTAQRLANAQAIQAAIDNVTDGATVQLPPGDIYLDNTQVTINKHGVRILGMGKRTTRIFTSGTAFSFAYSDNAATDTQCEIGNLSIGGIDNTAKKIGIKATDTTMLYIHDIAFVPNTFNGSSSTAIELHGRDMTTIERVDLYADQPLHIMDNPYSTIDSDHTNLHDFRASAEVSTNYNILIDNGVNLYNFVMDGTNVLSGGKGGIYWNDSARSIAPVLVHISGVRYEQPQDNTGYFAYIAGTVNPIQGFTLISNHSSGNHNGLYLRGILSASLIENYLIAPAGYDAINADNTVFNIMASNYYIYPGALNNITMTPKLYLPGYGSPSAGIGLAFYHSVNDSTLNGNIVVDNIAIGAGGTTITKHLSGTGSVDFGATDNNACDDNTITLSGAAVGDTVSIGLDNVVNSLTRSVVYGFVSSANTVTIRRCNISNGPGVNPAAMTVRVDVWKH